MKYPKVIDVKPLDNYKILVFYETNERKIFDVTPYITGEWFGKLKNEAVFNTVRPYKNTVEWEDGQDIAPHELYENSKNAE
jgi:hypothetical protein